MRLLSGRISQHHLHLYSINDLAVEHCHGLVSTLRHKHTSHHWWLITNTYPDNIWVRSLFHHPLRSLQVWPGQQVSSTRLKTAETSNGAGWRWFTFGGCSSAGFTTASETTWISYALPDATRLEPEASGVWDYSTDNFILNKTYFCTNNKNCFQTKVQGVWLKTRQCYKSTHCLKVTLTLSGLDKK